MPVLNPELLLAGQLRLTGFSRGLILEEVQYQTLQSI